MESEHLIVFVLSLSTFLSIDYTGGGCLGYNILGPVSAECVTYIFFITNI